MFGSQQSQSTYVSVFQDFSMYYSSHLSGPELAEFYSSLHLKPGVRSGKDFPTFYVTHIGQGEIMNGPLTTLQVL